MTSAGVKKAAHRPTGYSRTLEASALFNALRRRGLTWGVALAIASDICFVSQREIRRGANITPIDPESEDNMARFALAKKGRTLEDLVPPVT